MPALPLPCLPACLALHISHASAPFTPTAPLQVQAGPGVPAASVGGFGHTQRAGSGQRVDVTGHVCCAFSRLLEILDQQHEE